MEGLGTTVDVVLVNGVLREGDKIVVCGLGGPLVTRVKALKTPQVRGSKVAVPPPHPTGETFTGRRSSAAVPCTRLTSPPPHPPTLVLSLSVVILLS